MFNSSSAKTVIQLGLIAGRRQISTSTALNGKRNFRKFMLHNKRGSRIYKEKQRTAERDLPIDKRGVRDTGVEINGKFHEIPEKIPQLVVPNLADCKLKPYVSYKSPEIVQSEFTSLDLFNSVYGQKIIEDFNQGKLNGNDEPLEPSADEKLTPIEAWQNARKTGSDIF